MSRSEGGRGKLRKEEERHTHTHTHTHTHLLFGESTYDTAHERGVQTAYAAISRAHSSVSHSSLHADTQTHPHTLTQTRKKDAIGHIGHQSLPHRVFQFASERHIINIFHYINSVGFKRRGYE